MLKFLMAHKRVISNISYLWTCVCALTIAK